MSETEEYLAPADYFAPTDRVECEAWRLDQLAKIEPLAVQVLAAERRIIQRVIDLCQGNREAAAIRLGIARVTLYRKMGSK